MLILLNQLKAPKNDILYYNYNKALKNSILDKKSEDQIRKDLNRTFNDHKYYKSSQFQGFFKLERLLKVISDYKGISYIQGFNFIAASLLQHCDEE